MNQRFKDVKVIAWDVDTTLYKPIPKLSFLFKEECIKEVARVKNIPPKEAKELFEREREKLDSSTVVLQNLKVGDALTIAKIQEKIDKPSFIKKDPKLLAMFGKLSKFRHFLITNSMIEDDRLTLKKLGLPESLFERIITVEDTGEPKPSLAPFKLLLKITGLKPEEHLYVGDREKVDIEPAKEIGLRTILVWGESRLADSSLPTVYDIVKLLT